MRPARPSARPSARRRLAAWVLAGVVGGACPAPVGAGGSSSPRDQTGLQAMPATPNTGSVLVDYYEALGRDGDLEAFRRNVAARFNEATLARLLQGGEASARQAAVLSLGLFGTYKASNAAVARALRDPDPTVRALANDAAWSLWYRGDSPENNARLDEVRRRLGRGDLPGAIERADRLIADAPTFAEAYNQRAIARFVTGDLAASVADCRLVLQHNPYHIGALAGMGRCLLQLGRRDEAIAAFRRAAEIQPFDTGLKGLIAALEADR